MENWKPIPGFNGYEVSDHGRIRSYKRSNIPRILKPSKKKGGYLRVDLYTDGKGHHRNIAPLVMLAFVGKPNGRFVCHENSVSDDNRLCNLRYDTHLGNMRDRRKVTDEQVIEIRKRRNAGEPSKNLAEYHGVSVTYINCICRHARCQHVK